MVSPTMKLMLVLTALTSISASRLPSTDNEKCTCDLDLAFILDSSDHVMNDNFIAEQTFSMALVGRLHELEERLGAKSLRRRTAVMQYSNIIDPSSKPFSKKLSDVEVQKTIRHFRYIKSSQNTVDAINDMTSIYRRESQDKHIRVALLYTDDERRIDLRQAVEAAKRDHGITFITVGIKEITSMTCHLTTSPPHDICEMRDLDKIIKEITETLKDEVAVKCTCIEKPPCNCTDGEKGSPGQPGDNGSPGVPGRNGPDGPQGGPGRNGDPGRKGTPGKPGPRGDKGDMGQCGIRGIPGYMGPPGRDGEDGRKGQKGGPGPRGDTGPEGSEGKKGEMGYDGPPGQKGELGLAIPGRPGEMGLPGSMGPEGPPGNGVNGSLGPRGKHGDNGPRGEKGDSRPGQQGENGHEGLPGQKGQPGLGSRGDKGEAGPIGYSGPIGLPGLNGHGDMGKQGPEGPMGNQGPMGKSMPGREGLPGYPGDQGPPGEDGIGAPGQEGRVGEKGVDGQPGNNGEDGAPGHRGESGSTGPPGPEGKPGHGTRGDMGDLGKPGSRGPPGYPGHPGDQGAKGENGTAGLTGKTGPRGPATQGATGPDGLRGPHGPPGPSVTGPPGKQGTPGSPGLTGTIGQPGTSHPGYMGRPGLNGTKGETGPEGTGNSGPPGDRGYKGDNGEVGPPGKVVTVDGKPGSSGPPGPRGHRGMDAKGQPGAPGPKGEPGHTGPKGVGYSGEKGKPGIPGKDGPKGNTGPIGREGPPGLDGKEGKQGPCALTKKIVIDEIHKICVCSKIICKNLPPLELVFIIDSSGSIGNDSFNRFVKPFVRDIVGKFTIAPKATRVGLVLYSSTVKVVFDLNSIEYETLEDIKDRIMHLEYLGAGTYTGQAIKKATENVFNKARDGVRKVAIVITDGESNNYGQLEEAVNAAKGKGIVMHAVGIHNESNAHFAKFKEELSLIASEKEYLHHVTDTSTLAESEKSILGTVCTGEDDGAVKPEEIRARTQTKSHADRRCNLPATDRGTCGTWTRVWSYNKQNKICIKFWYGGCGGNDNRFETEDECITACVRR